jgi:hypothetical protein
MPFGSVICVTAGYFAKRWPKLWPLSLVGIVMAVSGLVLFIIGH